MYYQVVLVLKTVAVVCGLIAAALWLASAQVTLPDNQDAFIAPLQKLNSIGPVGASVAAIAGLVLWATGE